LLARLETHRRRLPIAEHPLINKLATESAPETLGAKTLTEALTIGLRISETEARRRIREAEDLGPRTALSGELLEPRLPTTATGQAAGLIGAENVKVIQALFAKLPGAVDYQTAKRPRGIWASSPVSSDPPNYALPPIIWLTCSTRTARLLPMPTGRGSATSPWASSKQTE
jgi:hypothetical protein